MADPAIMFTIAGDELHMHYQPRDGDEWVHRRFEKGEDLLVKRTFRLTKQLLVDPPAAALDKMATSHQKMTAHPSRYRRLQARGLQSYTDAPGGWSAGALQVDEETGHEGI